MFAQCQSLQFSMRWPHQHLPASDEYSYNVAVLTWSYTGAIIHSRNKYWFLEREREDSSVQWHYVPDSQDQIRVKSHWFRDEYAGVSEWHVLLQSKQDKHEQTQMTMTSVWPTATRVSRSKPGSKQAHRATHWPHILNVVVSLVAYTTGR